VSPSTARMYAIHTLSVAPTLSEMPYLSRRVRQRRQTPRPWVGSCILDSADCRFGCHSTKYTAYTDLTGQCAWGMRCKCALGDCVYSSLLSHWQSKPEELVRHACLLVYSSLLSHSQSKPEELVRHACLLPWWVIHRCSITCWPTALPLCKLLQRNLYNQIYF